MSIASTLTAQAMELLPRFQREHPGHDADALAARFAKGVKLWRLGAVFGHDAATGCYRVRCERPELTWPGESMAYWTLPNGPRGSKCDCADWTFRGIICKHIAAVFLVRRLGQAPVPGQLAERTTPRATPEPIMV